jgi:hypothetical protein
VNPIPEDSEDDAGQALVFETEALVQSFVLLLHAVASVTAVIRNATLVNFSADI